MLFNFHLRPLRDVSAWDHPKGPRLSWFGFTDGWYWIQAGHERLFTLSPEMAKRWASKDAGDFGAFTDYYVVRLWEDILQILPDVLNPLSPEIAELLSGSEPRIGPWLQLRQA